MKRRRVLFALLLLIPNFGCATFSYDRAPGASPPAESRTGLRIGVARFSQPPASGFYPIWFSNTLADPIGDFSRAVAEELRGSGRFADVIYLGAAPLEAADLAYYRDVYQLDAVLAGAVTNYYVTAVAELWSLMPPFILLWPLHLLGLPVAPSHDSVALDVTLSLRGVSPGTGAWRAAEQRLSWHERAWYSVLNIPANERAVQTHALDHFVTALAASLLRELPPARADEPSPRPAAASPPAR